MQIRLKRLWASISTSLWFIPSIMTLGAIVIAFFFIQLDREVKYKLISVNWYMYGGSASGARTLLSTIAGSMITITGVVFSITLVALTLASSQFGPRLLRNFIKDKGNQVVLGTFISTFIYSLIVLLSIRGLEENSFVPKISIIVAFAFSLGSFGVLIYFIHHVSSSIQADNVIHSAYRELCDAIEKLMDDTAIHPPIIVDKLLTEYSSSTVPLMPFYATRTGYIQAIDYHTACKIARDENAVIELFYLPGEFIVDKTYLGNIQCTASTQVELMDSLTDLYILGNMRTPEQEIEFGINQIVEIAMRALSPGINDPNTAIICIHWLGAAIVEISKKHFPPGIITDDDGNLRVVRKVHSYQTIVHMAFDQVLLYGSSNPAILQKMLETLQSTSEISFDNNLKRELKLMAEKVLRRARQEIDDPMVIEKLEKYLQRD
jgi:uncharacterized membrane protein